VKFFVLVGLVLPATLLAQSPFDGTWVINSGAVQFSDKPESYSLSDGKFCCFLTTSQVDTDGRDHKIKESPYADTESVRVVDERTIQVIAKKGGKTTYTETYTVSADGNTLTNISRDMTEAEAVIVETTFQRVANGAALSHAISGSWRAYKTKRSDNGSVVKYKCTQEGFSAETPLGEKYFGKFDGRFYPTEDDPGHTLASVRLLDTNTVELTQKREGKISGVLRLTVAPDGKSIHGVFTRKPDNTKSSFEMEKQQP
jgi:hypothetical protein